MWRNSTPGPPQFLPTEPDQVCWRPAERRPNSCTLLMPTETPVAKSRINGEELRHSDSRKLPNLRGLRLEISRGIHPTFDKKCGAFTSCRFCCFVILVCRFQWWLNFHWRIALAHRVPLLIRPLKYRYIMFWSRIYKRGLPPPPQFFWGNNFSKLFLRKRKCGDGTEHFVDYEHISNTPCSVWSVILSGVFRWRKTCGNL